MNTVLKILAEAVLEKNLGKNEEETAKILDTMFKAQITNTAEELGYVPSLLIKTI